MTGSPPDQPANVLGALALAVADRLGDALGHSQSAAAALVALDQFLDGPSVDRLAQVVGLSQSGAVRLVDRLEGDGYVRRAPAGDARSRAVRLTAPGRQAARRVEQRRMALLGDVLSPLGEDERRAFAELAGRLLVGMMREPGAARWTCRLCDMGSCGRPKGNCPLEREARRRYG